MGGPPEQDMPSARPVEERVEGAFPGSGLCRHLPSSSSHPPSALGDLEVGHL